MPPTFTTSELVQVPAELRPLLTRFPQSLDNFLDAQGKPPIPEPYESIEVYFDDDVTPAMSFSEGKVSATESTDDPMLISVMVNDEYAYLQAGDVILLNRVSESILDIFEVG